MGTPCQTEHTRVAWGYLTPLRGPGKEKQSEVLAHLGQQSLVSRFSDKDQSLETGGMWDTSCGIGG